jgi:hypothetical protein
MRIVKERACPQLRFSIGSNLMLGMRLTEAESVTRT